MPVERPNAMTAGTTVEDYSAAYYAAHLGEDAAYGWENPAWRGFFQQAPDRLVAALNISSSLDVGCAKGLLVQALAKKDVDAHGFDISSHAIANATAEVRERLYVASATERTEGRWSLISCIELLKHMSSSPTDFREPAHFNVTRRRRRSSGSRSVASTAVPTSTCRSCRRGPELDRTNQRLRAAQAAAKRQKEKLESLRKELKYKRFLVKKQEGQLTNPAPAAERRPDRARRRQGLAQPPGRPTGHRSVPPMSDAQQGVTFSVVTPVYNTPPRVLRDMMESVLGQTYDDWKLILVDDRSTEPGVLPQLRAYAEADARIRVVERAENGHIVAASNYGIRAARGEIIVLLDHDDLLTPDALERNARVIAEQDDVDYLYSDEDKVDDEGVYFDAFRRPAWSPERLRGQMLKSHLSVLRSQLREMGGLHEGFDGSQDHDLALRVIERSRRSVHIPEILYHWRTIPGWAAADVDAKPYTWVAGLNAVQEHLHRVGIAGEVGYGPSPGLYTVSRTLDPSHRVSLVIPTNGACGLTWGERRIFVVEAVRSALAHTRHQDVEVVVVYDSRTSPEALDQLSEIAGDNIVLVRFHEEFNFSRKMNLGVMRSSGDRVVLLNDDVQVRSEGWLEELVAPLDEPDVGMVGAKLYFSNDLIQHVGHAYERGHYRHESIDVPRESLGSFGMLSIARDVSGVPTACAAMRRDTFLRVGGFAEALPVNFNDVDLCYKVRFTGQRIIVVPACELYHWERILVQTRWGVPRIDPYSSHVRRGPNAHEVDVWVRQPSTSDVPAPA